MIMTTLDPVTAWAHRAATGSAPEPLVVYSPPPGCEPARRRDRHRRLLGACHVDTAAVLLDHGADLDRGGYDEFTPLNAARRSKRTTP